MLLKHMKLFEFRQFRNTEIDFSTNSEEGKNVTIIMGENGTGKTTLAQAFTWCLYGNTDFNDQNVLNFVAAKDLGPNNSAKVVVEIVLMHNSREYILTRSQKYISNSKGEVGKPNNTILQIQYKEKDGNTVIVKDSETEITVKEILPKEISRYFFFDGERIGNMSKEISKGRSKEFAEAVKGLLGLKALSTAMDHLNGRSPSSVIKLYDSEYNSDSDSDIKKYREELNVLEYKLENLNIELEEKQSLLEDAKESVTKYETLLRENAVSKNLQEEREELTKKIKYNIEHKNLKAKELIKIFNHTGVFWISQKMMKDALDELKEHESMDKGIPDITKKTIEFLLNEKKCICGHPIEFGSEEYNKLNELLEYIPPKALGNQLNDFMKQCKENSSKSEIFFDTIKNYYSDMRQYEFEKTEIEERLYQIDNTLKGLKDVGVIQNKLSFYKEEEKKLNASISDMKYAQGICEANKQNAEKSMDGLALKDKHNRKIAQYKAYAKYIYEIIKTEYEQKEKETREKLNIVVNRIFKKIYNGGFSIALDDKYNISVLVDDFEGFKGEVETSTAQSISVILAFIAGVIELARVNNKSDCPSLETEAYPLVMDAPLSAFDKTRIQTVCEVLPKIAEQVIIFIKDTDGEIAEKYLKDKICKKYNFVKINEFESDLN